VNAGSAIVDPLADRLADCVRAPEPVEQILALRQVFPEKLAMDPAFRQPLAAAVAGMRTEGVAAVIGRALTACADH
jgi:fructuronate reductase